MKHRLFSIIYVAAATLLNGADITPGYYFVAGDTVTHSKLNTAAAGTINATFIGGKTEKTIPDGSADYLLLYDSSAIALKKITVGNIGWLNTNYIAGRAEATGAAPNDYLMLWSTASQAYRKISLANGIFQSTNLVLNHTNIAAPGLSYYLLGDGGTGPSIVKAGQLFTNAWLSFTNNSTVTNGNLFLVWDGAACELRSIDYLILSNAAQRQVDNTTASTNLITSLPAGSNPTNGDYFVVFSAASNALVKYNWSSMSNAVYSGLASQKFAGSEIKWPGLGTNYFAVPHGLPGTPQIVRWVAVCKTNDCNYPAGEEVDILTIGKADTYTKLWAVSADSTNVYLMFFASVVPTGCGVFSRTNGTWCNLTEARWAIKPYAVYYP